VRQIEATELPEALGIMTQLIAALRVSEEGQDGLAAFLEKREPRWRSP
jgi:methylglutaconyl-CoA hydratase